jgi:hypothetical protein
MDKDLKKYSIIALTFVFVIAAIYQITNVSQYQKTKKTLLQDTFSGIVTEKGGVSKGNFELFIKIANDIKAIELEGASEYYDKYSVGDSIVKLPNSYLFKVYRGKSGNGEREYLYTVGYTP